MTSPPPAQPAWRARLGLALLWLSLAALVAAVLAASGAISGFSLGPFRVSIRNLTNPALIAIVAGVVGARLLGARAAGSYLERLDGALASASPILAVALSLFVLATTIVAGAQIAGGADSSGYLSEARLWQQGTLVQAPPLANSVPLAHPTQAFVPIGFRLAASGTEMAPVYPPGLPLLMALASSLGGDGAQFYVVPVCAAGVVLLAYAIGRRFGGPHLGLVSAAAAAVSPILMIQAVQPMSDVPAAFWWLLAFVLLTSESVPAAAAAGVAAAVAGLVRPNLFAMVPVIAALAATWEDTWSRGAKRAIAFVMPVAPAAVAFALWQRSIYGSTTETGYGGFSYLFSLSHVLPNLSRYGWWLIDSHSTLVFAALVAPLLIARGWSMPIPDSARAARIGWSALAMFGALLAFYALYLVFDAWVYLRFLLPAIPPVLALMLLPPLVLLRRAGGPLRGGAVIALLLVVLTWGFSRSRGLGAFLTRQNEQRYADVADFARGLEPSAVFATMQHSGSLHYYTARPILRWDWTDPSEIDRAMAALRGAGHAVYVVLDDWEEPDFRTRFAGTRTLASLGRPILTTTGPAIHTSVYRVEP